MVFPLAVENSLLVVYCLIKNITILILQYTVFAGAIFIQWSNSLTGQLSLIITFNFLCKKKKNRFHSKRGIAVYSCPWNSLLTQHISMLIYITLEWKEMKRLHKLNISYKEFGIRKQTKSEDLFLSFFSFFPHIYPNVVISSLTFYSQITSITEKIF